MHNYHDDPRCKWLTTMVVHPVTQNISTYSHLQSLIVYIYNYIYELSMDYEPFTSWNAQVTWENSNERTTTSPKMVLENMNTLSYAIAVPKVGELCVKIG